MDTRRFRDLIARFLSNKTNETENVLIDYWYHSFDLKHNDPGQGERQVARRSIWAAINQEIALQRTMKRRKIYRWSAAAAVTALMAGSIVLYKNSNTDKPVYSWQQYYTGTGQIKTLTLPDSSRLTLNANTGIAVRLPFNTDKRVVQLTKGEVFFEVRHKTEAPFIVQTGRLSTQVLGTTFNIRSSKQLNRIVVMLRSGKISVSDPGKKAVVLYPGQQITVDYAKSSFGITNVDTENYLKWREREYILHNADISEIAELIKDHYGLQVRAGSARVRNYRFSLPLNFGYPAQETIRRICKIHHNQFKKEGNTIIIY